jgi:hypothetical protein
MYGDSGWLSDCLGIRAGLSASSPVPAASLGAALVGAPVRSYTLYICYDFFINHLTSTTLATALLTDV